MRRKNCSRRWTVPPTGHKKGGDIQGIRTASAAGAETLSDALGTRLPKHYENEKNFLCLKIAEIDMGGSILGQEEQFWT